MKDSKVKATILKDEITGLENIVEAMFYESVEKATLSDGRIIEVYGDGTYTTYPMMSKNYLITIKTLKNERL